MNFIRKKPPQPITILQTLFKEATETSNQCYDLENANDIKRAYQGWKALYTNILYKLESIHKNYNMDILSSEETYFFVEIQRSSSLARDNMNRLEVKLMKELSDLNSATSKKSGTNGSSSVSQSQTSDLQSRRMLKTLRSPHLGGSLQTTSKFHTAKYANNTSTSLLSKTAASHIWKEDDHKTSPPPSVKSPDMNSLFNDFSAVNDAGDLLSRSKKSTNTLTKVKLNPKSNFSKASETTSESKTPKQKPPVRPKPRKHLTTKPILDQSKSKPQSAALKASQISSSASAKAKAKKSTLEVPKPVMKKTSSAPSVRQSSPKRKPRPKAPTSISTSTVNEGEKERGEFKKSVGSEEEENEKDTENTSDGNKLGDSASLIDQPVLDLQTVQEQIISEIKGIDKDAARQIFNDIVDQGDEVHWEDIAGLETAKNSLKEAVVYPFLRPDLFSGLREPARGMLLFGPPGTGKTMLAKAVATESKSTFFSISASSLTSKFLGESEKLVRALFLLAKKLSPSIIFVDEIDSLLSARSDNENESTRRIKTEFLIQWNDLSHAAVGSSGNNNKDFPRVLVLAATNLPWNIDEAARRRFVRRQYIPLPEKETRRAQFVKMLSHQKTQLPEEELQQLVDITEGFSGSDITALTKDAAMNPLRELGEKLLFTPKEEIRGLELVDFQTSMKYIRPSVSSDGLAKFADWASKYGSSGV